MDENLVTSKVYDLCIVGAGMIGSAAARHASKIHGKQICLVGPKEPQNRQESSILGSHYDESRLYRSSDSISSLWALFSRRTVQRYDQLEALSGIKFYNEAGVLTVMSQLNANFKTLKSSLTALSPSVQVLDSDEARSRFPFINLARDHHVVCETQEAGYLNPRKLINAEQTVGHLQGCDIFNDIVDHVTDLNQSADGSRFYVECQSGHKIYARKVLLATGAFTEFRNLLPDDMAPDLKVITQTVLFAEMRDHDVKSFRDMRPMIYRTSELDTQEDLDCYVVPPIKYPNGKYYMKLGHGGQFERILSTESEVAGWLQQDPSEDIKTGMLHILTNVFPDIRPASVHYDTCVTARTYERRPFIDLVNHNMGVALGGNGYAAKSCDEIGRLAIELLMNGTWDCPLPRDVCKLRTKSPLERNNKAKL